jgi:hypothetical protein
LKRKIFIFSLGAVMNAALAEAGSITLDPVSFAVVVNEDNVALSVCSSTSPCGATATTLSTVGLILPPSNDPDGSPYSGSAFATAISSPQPSLDVSASASAQQLEYGAPPDGPFFFSASAGLTYYVELSQIAGDPYTGPVPVLTAGSTTLTTYGSTDGIDMTTISTSLTVGTADGVTTLYTLPAGTNGSFSQTISMVAGVEYEVVMGASVTSQVGAGDDSSPTEVATAIVDPVFTVSPDYANDFQLSFSDGIGNGGGSVAPEPSTWAMIVLGAGVLGLRRLRG